MKYDCGMIVDLLPLYADEVCSEVSRKVVEDHLLECENCRNALEQMRAEMPKENVPEFSEQEVLKKTTWNISKRAILAAAGVTAIVLYWLVFVWQEALSDMGDYRFFSYRFHEVYGIGYLLVPIISAVWLIVSLSRVVKAGAWRRNLAMLLILGLLTVGQFCFWYQQSQMVSVTCVSEVVEIPDEYHVVIESWQGNVTLKTTPSVTKLLQDDGTKYVFTYECNKRDRDEGTLSYASYVDD